MHVELTVSLCILLQRIFKSCIICDKNSCIIDRLGFSMTCLRLSIHVTMCYVTMYVGLLELYCVCEKLIYLAVLFNSNCIFNSCYLLFSNRLF